MPKLYYLITLRGFNHLASLLSIKLGLNMGYVHAKFSCKPLNARRVINGESFLQNGGHGLSVPCSQRFLTQKRGQTLTTYNSKRIYPFDFKPGTSMQCIDHYLVKLLVSLSNRMSVSTSAVFNFCKLNHWACALCIEIPFLWAKSMLMFVLNK